MQHHTIRQYFSMRMASLGLVALGLLCVLAFVIIPLLGYKMPVDSPGFIWKFPAFMALGLGGAI